MDRDRGAGIQLMPAVGRLLIARQPRKAKVLVQGALGKMTRCPRSKSQQPKVPLSAGQPLLPQVETPCACAGEYRREIPFHLQIEQEIHQVISPTSHSLDDGGSRMVCSGAKGGKTMGFCHVPNVLSTSIPLKS